MVLSSKYTCKQHKVLCTKAIVPSSPYDVKCVHCLQKKVTGYGPLFHVATPEYNYLFPMLCHRCSEKMRTCMWCRPLRKCIVKNTESVFGKLFS